MKLTRRLLVILVLAVAAALIALVPATALADDVDYTAPGCTVSRDGRHHPGQGDSHTLADCTHPRYDWMYCAWCGELYSVITEPALGHDWVYQSSSAATCEDDGVTIYKCSRCGETYRRTTPALGHDWDEGVVQSGGGGTYLHTTETLFTCKRDPSHTKVVSSDGSETFFSGVTAPAEDDNPLYIVEQPVGGNASHGGTSGTQLKVVVGGGTKPYSYQWYYRSTFIRGGLGTVLEEVGSKTDSAGKVFSGKGGRFSDAFQQLTTDDEFGRGSLVTNPSRKPMPSFVPGTTVELTTSKAIPGATDSIYEATRGNCTYWCVITDELGRTITTDKVQVGYGLFIMTEPSNANTYGPGGKREVVRLVVQAAGGTGTYTYQWYDASGTPVTGATNAVLTTSNTGIYYCVVSDGADEVRSWSARVSYVEPLSLSMTPDTSIEGDDPTMEVTAGIIGGEGPYTFVWQFDGEPFAYDTPDVSVDSDIQAISSVTATEFGRYRVTVTDGWGQSISEYTDVIRRTLTITQQPEGGTLNTRGRLQVTIAVGDGVKPYTYVLLKDGKEYERDTGKGASFTKTIYESGEYAIQVIDSVGGTATSDTFTVLPNDFTFASYPEGTVEVSYAGDEVKLAAEVQGGTAPYIFQWKRFDESNGTILWESDPYVTTNPTTELKTSTLGTYRLFVTDAYGQELIGDGCVVAYAGSKPFITVHPGSVESPYVTEMQFQLECKAFTGTGDAVSYTWESLNFSTFDWEDRTQEVVSQGGKMWAISSELWVCKVTNTVTGESTYSKTARIVMGLECTDVHQVEGTGYIEFTLRGGNLAVADFLLIEDKYGWASAGSYEYPASGTDASSLASLFGSVTFADCAEIVQMVDTSNNPGETPVITYRLGPLDRTWTAAGADGQGISGPYRYIIRVEDALGKSVCMWVEMN